MTVFELGSLPEFVTFAKGRAERLGVRHPDEPVWTGGTFDEACELASVGWDEHLSDTVRVAREAVQAVERDHQVDTFAPVWDVTGSSVDVAAFIDGTPECMIDFTPSKVSRVGKVVTLSASVRHSASFTPEEVIRRGQGITALALALADLGHAFVLYADATYPKGAARGTVRVLVKGVDDILDPSRVLYALAHPSMLRHLVLSSIPREWNTGGTRTCLEDLPEGAIYLPGLTSGEEVPTAAEFVAKYLGELALL